MSEEGSEKPPSVSAGPIDDKDEPECINPLTDDMIAEGLSEVSRTPDGFAFAFTKLILEEKKIDDLGVKLQDFVYLREVSWAKNEIRNFDEVIYLHHLTNLDLSKNRVKEYKFLKENPSNLCFLKDLNLADNQLRELSDFPQQRLEKVDLTNNKIEKCDEFNGALCKSVMNLILNKNRLTDLTGLSGMQGLIELNLSENKITSLKGLCQFPNLQKLNVASNLIVELDVVPELPALTNFDLSGNKIADLKQVNKMEGLSALDCLNMLETPLAEEKGDDLRKEIIIALTSLPWKRINDEDIEESQIAEAKEEKEERRKAAEEAEKERLAELAAEEERKKAEAAEAE